MILAGTLGLTKEKFMNQTDKSKIVMNESKDKENLIESIGNKNQLETAEKEKSEQIKQLEQTKQLENYYRSRHASFLNNLKENLKNRKLMEENEKKKKDLTLAKIRENMGINNVTSKLFEYDKNKDQRPNVNQEKIQNDNQKEIPRSQSAEGEALFLN